jgi:hypothetical protein
MLLLRDDSKRNHILDKLIKAARTEIAKVLGDGPFLASPSSVAQKAL